MRRELSLKDIHKELVEIRKDLALIKSNMVGPDRSMSDRQKFLKSQNELKTAKPSAFSDARIYKDKRLIAGVKQSMKEARSGKGRILKSDSEIDKYFKALC